MASDPSDPEPEWDDAPRREWPSPKTLTDSERQAVLEEEERRWEGALGIPLGLLHEGNSESAKVGSGGGSSNGKVSSQPASPMQLQGDSPPLSPAKPRPGSGKFDDSDFWSNDSDNVSGCEADGDSPLYVKLSRADNPGYTLGSKWKLGRGVPDGMHPPDVKTIVDNYAWNTTAKLLVYRNSTVAASGKHGTLVDDDDREDYRSGELNECVVVEIKSMDKAYSDRIFKAQFTLTVVQFEALFDWAPKARGKLARVLRAGGASDASIVKLYGPRPQAKVIGKSRKGKSLLRMQRLRSLPLPQARAPQRPRQPLPSLTSWQRKQMMAWRDREANQRAAAQKGSPISRAMAKIREADIAREKHIGRGTLLGPNDNKITEEGAEDAARALAEDGDFEAAAAAERLAADTRVWRDCSRADPVLTRQESRQLSRVLGKEREMSLAAAKASVCTTRHDDMDAMSRAIFPHPPFPDANGSDNDDDELCSTATMAAAGAAAWLSEPGTVTADGLAAEVPSRQGRGRFIGDLYRLEEESTTAGEPTISICEPRLGESEFKKLDPRARGMYDLCRKMISRKSPGNKAVRFSDMCVNETDEVIAGGADALITLRDLGILDVWILAEGAVEKMKRAVKDYHRAQTNLGEASLQRERTAVQRAEENLASIALDSNIWICGVAGSSGFFEYQPDASSSFDDDDDQHDDDQQAEEAAALAALQAEMAALQAQNEAWMAALQAENEAWRGGETSLQTEHDDDQHDDDQHDNDQHAAAIPIDDNHDNHDDDDDDDDDDDGGGGDGGEPPGKCGGSNRDFDNVGQRVDATKIHRRTRGVRFLRVPSSDIMWTWGHPQVLVDQGKGAKKAVGAVWSSRETTTARDEDDDESGDDDESSSTASLPGHRMISVCHFHLKQAVNSSSWAKDWVDEKSNIQELNEDLTSLVNLPHAAQAVAMRRLFISKWKPRESKIAAKIEAWFKENSHSRVEASQLNSVPGGGPASNNGAESQNSKIKDALGRRARGLGNFIHAFSKQIRGKSFGSVFSQKSFSCGLKTTPDLIRK